MSFETVDNGKDYGDNEVWTCDVCGHQILLEGTGGDVACCPICTAREHEDDANAEKAKEWYRVVWIPKDASQTGEKGVEGILDKMVFDDPVEAGTYIGIEGMQMENAEFEGTGLVVREEPDD